jgi:outer membrane lipoprotein-sorting protein
MAGRQPLIVFAAGILAALVCGTASSPAYADSVPLPIPAPLAKTGTVTPAAAAPVVPPASIPDASASTTSSTSTATPAPESNSFFPFSLPFDKNTKPEQATAFDPQQRQLLHRISQYLSGVQTLVGNFVQIGPDGGRTEGTFYIQKPGKVRFDYNPPTPTEVIADGSSVVVRNRDLNTQELWPLSQTPLRYLLAKHIDLLRDTNVVSVSSDDKYDTVVIEQKEAMVGTTRLMIMFDAKDLTLKQWTVTDPQGLNTTVAVSNLDTTAKPNPKLFVINYQRNIGATNE